MDIEANILLLESLTEKYRDYWNKTRRLLARKSDKDIEELIKACKTMSTTNCGADTYRSAQHVIDVATWIKITRRSGRNKRNTHVPILSMFS